MKNVLKWIFEDWGPHDTKLLIKGAAAAVFIFAAALMLHIMLCTMLGIPA